MTDPREAAANYLAQRNHDPDAEGETGTSPGAAAAVDRAAFIESAIQVAIRRGEFDDLPGAGKPLEGLGAHHDPDWWIRRKIETENLTGLGPPAILLRNEDRELNDQLDLLSREGDVREVVEDFNRRVIEARRQLQGGPPVVTSPRDIDGEIAAWRDRRAARAAASVATQLEPATRRRRFGIRRKS